MMKKTVLILGATGRFGRNAQISFSWAGWDVRCFDRATDNLEDAAWGVDLIVNAWNPAYTDWATDIPRYTQQVINVAKDTGAAVLIPGNIYVYGEAMPQELSENTPHLATNPLGKIRVEMEQAYKESGVKTIILRAGDYIDTEASGNWFDKIITAKAERGVTSYPGAPDIPHAWAFLPDVTDMAAVLADNLDELDTWTDVFAPSLTLTGQELAHAISEVSGRSQTLKPMAWFPIQVASLVWPLGRSLLEMRFLWDKPHEVCSVRAQTLVPDFIPTSLEDTLAASLPEQINPHGLVRRPRPKVPGLLSAFNCRCVHSQPS